MNIQKMIKTSSQMALVVMLSSQVVTSAFAQEATVEESIMTSEEIIDQVNEETTREKSVESTEASAETFVGQPLPSELVGNWETTGDLFEIKNQSIVYGLPAEEYKITEYTIETVSDTIVRYTILWDEAAYKQDYDKQDDEINPQPFVFEYSSETQELSMGSIENGDITYTKVTEFENMTEDEAVKYIDEQGLVAVVRENLNEFSEDVQPLIEQMSDEDIKAILVEQFTTTPGLGDFGVTEQLIKNQASTVESSESQEESESSTTSVDEASSTVAELTTSATSAISSEETTKQKMKELFVNKVKEGDKTVSGTVEPGSRVLVYFEKAQEKVTVNADAKGNWSVQVPAGVTLKAGDTISVTVTYPNKQVDGKQVKVLTGLQAMLPQTGEQSNIWMLLGGAILVLAAIGLFISNKKKNKK